MAHSTARDGDVPFCTSTVATAMPSGMLCAPMAAVTITPWRGGGEGQRRAAPVRWAGLCAGVNRAAHDDQITRCFT